MASENLDSLEQWGVEVILGQRRGVRAGTLRLFLNGLSRIFHGRVQGRLALFRHRVKTDYYLGATVISIGNLTVEAIGESGNISLENVDRPREVADAILAGMRQARLNRF